MERINDRLTELASTFEYVDLEVIEGVLEMCQNNVDKAAEILLKMQEDANVQEKEPVKEIKKETRSKPNESKHMKEQAEEEFDVEKEYMEDVQKAIERSLHDKQKVSVKKGDEKYSDEMKQAIKLSIKESKEKEKVNKRKSSSPKFGEKLKNMFRKKSEHKDERSRNDDEEIVEIIKPSPDEDIIQFVFKGNALIKGERSF